MDIAADALAVLLEKLDIVRGLMRDSIAQQRSAGEEVRRPPAGSLVQVPQSGGTGGTGHRGTDPDGQGLPSGS